MITNLKKFATDNKIELTDQKAIVKEAADNITKRFHYSDEQIKQNFDSLFDATQAEIYEVYKKHQKMFGQQVMRKYAEHLEKEGIAKDIKQLVDILASSFELFDKFYLSLAQSRKQRAGSSFEDIHNALFKKLKYPFDEQRVINGKPDFIMPSYDHYMKNPMDCIIFTAKRTLRERWRQIVTEGTRGLGFYLATIDESISSNQINEALKNRIYIVCPERVRAACYSGSTNVLSFSRFFKDHLDPALERWKRNGIVK